MKNIIKETFVFTIILIYFYYCLTNYTYIQMQINFSIKIWLTKIIPSLFPTFIIADLIYNSNIPYYINKYLHLNYLYILSIICGSPTNAYIIKEYNISPTKLLAVTKYTSLLFTYNFLKAIFKPKIALIIIFTNILSNLILTLYIKPPKIQYKHNNNNLLNILIKSINKTTNTLISILGTIIFFNTLPTNIITNKYLKTTILSILEITTSLNNLITINIPLFIKLIFTLISLSTCGLCIECQIKSIISDTSINYLEYLKYRIYHLIIFITLTFIIITILL